MGIFSGLRQQLNKAVHETFSVAAVVYEPEADVGVDVTVRLHNREELIGDLNRQGFQQAVQEVEYAIFTKADYDAANVHKGMTLVLEDGRRFTLTGRRQTEGTFDVTYDVTRAEP